MDSTEYLGYVNWHEDLVGYIKVMMEASTKPPVQGSRDGVDYGREGASRSASEFSQPPCHNYRRGYCSYGESCRFSHEGESGGMAEQYEERLQKQVAFRKENNLNPLWDRLSSSDESSAASSEGEGDKEPANPATGRRKRSTSKSESESDSSSDSSLPERKRKRRRKKKKEKRKARSKRRKKRRKRRKRSPSTSSSSSSSESENDSGVKAPPLAKPLEDIKAELAEGRKETGVVSTAGGSDNEDIGPKPLEQVQVADLKQSAYGGAMLPGEGAAIAQYVQKNIRIPRRGEIGWSGKDIAEFEKAGYVMSGSRHTRMNAVRLRKENQVYTAEEKRALALRNFEEKQQREVNLMSEFRYVRRYTG